MSYQEAQCEKQDVLTIGEQSSIQGNLERKKKDLEKRLADVDAALSAISTNPETVKVLELINKAR